VTIDQINGMQTQAKVIGDDNVAAAMVEVAIEDYENNVQDQLAIHLETHQEILNLLAWTAWLAKTVPYCKCTFDDLVERLVQMGPLCAGLAKENQGIRISFYFCLLLFIWLVFLKMNHGSWCEIMWRNIVVLYTLH
jgi:hypothetical protein